MEAYTYSPLEECHVRLISVSLTTEDSLHITIKHVELYDKNEWVPYKRDPPPYIALSYVWGQSAPSVPIACNDGKVFLVTATLEEALRSVVKFNKENYDFWIDQISIDQTNDFEKSEQVRMMNDIFNSTSLRS
jgi:Heterokaryon incompatibility protein (HET)